MKHRYTAPFFAVLVLALAAFTGSAFAGGNGSGNGSSNGNSANAPGHQDPAPQAPAAAPAAAPVAPAPAAKKADKAAAPSTKKASKQSSTSAANPATGGSNAQGVKPSNTTKHDTYAKASSNQTKQYGNGKTAGQIATKAGYGDATLHGPGNSQPHKVLCGGHEVDVHALAHKKDKCGTASSTPATAGSQSSSTDSSTCATTTRTVTVQVPVVLHKTGNGKYVRIHPNAHSAHYSKHADDIKGFETVTKTESVPTGANCSSSAPTVLSTQVSGGPSAPAGAQVAGAVAAAPAATVSAAGTAPAATASAAGAAPATATPAVAGGVKGAVVTLHPTKTKPAGGVLGATTRLGSTVAGTTLPFTGLPLWIFTAVALALIAIGFGVRRTAADRI